MNEDDRVKVIIELYKQATEDIRDRRTIEWQTFAVVNVIYLGLLKVLYDYKGTLAFFQALMITIAVLLFTWIWFIRIYGNASRFNFPRVMRNRIQDSISCDHAIRKLVPPDCIGGGWQHWNGSWPLWSYRGICVVIWLYCAVFLIGVWHKMDGALFAINRSDKLLSDLGDLKKNTIPYSLRKEFEHNGISISPYVTSSYDESNNRWLIADRGNTYILEEKEAKVKVCRKFWWWKGSWWSWVIEGIILLAILVASYVLDRKESKRFKDKDRETGA